MEVRDNIDQVSTENDGIPWQNKVYRRNNIRQKGWSNHKHERVYVCINSCVMAQEGRKLLLIGAKWVESSGKNWLSTLVKSTNHDYFHILHMNDFLILNDNES